MKEIMGSELQENEISLQELMDEISCILVEARNRLEKKMVTIAKQLKLSLSTIAKWETGKMLIGKDYLLEVKQIYGLQDLELQKIEEFTEKAKRLTRIEKELKGSLILPDDTEINIREIEERKMRIQKEKEAETNAEKQKRGVIRYPGGRRSRKRRT